MRIHVNLKNQYNVEPLKVWYDIHYRMFLHDSGKLYFEQ